MRHQDLPELTPDHRVVFFTGAGMSAESGVPTYRGQGGIWHQYDYRSYACQQAFDRDPVAVWDFHNLRRKAVAECHPHRGHRIIVDLAARLADCTLVTQNIDGMHQRAGSERVHELHGSLWRVRCDACGLRQDNHEVPVTELRCACGKGWLRPDIVWFGDSLRGEVIQAAVDAIERCDVLVSIGTSAVVYPAAQLPTLAPDTAIRIEINPEPTPLSELYDHCLRGPASEMLQALLDAAPTLRDAQP